MKREKVLAIITMVCLCVSSLCGVLSANFYHAYNFVNQYGHDVEIYGYGIYGSDSFFKATIFIGTDFGIFFGLLPLFIYTFVKYLKKRDTVSEVKLVSVYAVSLYYGASLAFGVTYNQLFLVYIILFSSSLFGMLSHIRNIKITQSITVTKGLTAFLVISGIVLFVAWLPDIIVAMIKGETLSLIEVYTTEITYVIDMGIISPLCIITIILLKKRDCLGVISLAAILKLCIIVGVLLISQTACQMLAGVDLPGAALLTKTFSFVLLAGVAAYFNNKMYLMLGENSI